MKQTLFIALSLLLLFSSSAIAQEKAEGPFNFIQIGEVNVFGKSIDKQTRCVHWHSALDIIAIKFKCCDKYYPCFSCHEEEADHDHEVWPISEFDQKAILCGVCAEELSIEDYMASDNTCPNCASSFNPGCSNHYHLYFETPSTSFRDLPSTPVAERSRSPLRDLPSAQTAPLAERSRSQIRDPFRLRRLSEVEASEATDI